MAASIPAPHAPRTWTRPAESLAAFAIGALGIGLTVFAGPYLLGVDAYYHIQFASLTRQNGIVREFPWVQASCLGTHFADKEFLYHLLLVPFTFGDRMLGAKLAACFFGGLAFAAFHGLLRSQHIRAPLLWTVVLLCSGPLFLQRMSLTRPHVLSLILLLLTARYLHEGRAKALGFLAWLYALSYSAPQTILVVAALFNLGLWVGGDRVNPRTILYPAIGLVLGFLTHPHFPNNVSLWYLQNVLAPLHAWGILTPKLFQGMELLPPRGRDLLLEMPAVAVGVATGLAAYLVRGRKPSPRTWGWLVVMGFFSILTLFSVRFSEYSVPFALVFAASALSNVLQDIDWATWMERHPWGRNLVPSGVLLFLMLAGVLGVARVQGFVINDLHEPMAEAALWVRDNVPEGETVFHSDWGDFPELFFHAPRHRYLVGLDPVFMFVHDPSKWRLWTSITDGHRSDAPGLIRAEFNSRFVLTRTRARTAFDRQLRSLKRAKQRFRNSEFAVFELL